MDQPLPSVSSDGPLEVTANRQIEVKGVDVTNAPPPPTSDEVMAEIDRMALEVRKLILMAKKAPRIAGLEPHQEALRCLAQAQNHLQTGFMWLRRTVKQPKEF